MTKKRFAKTIIILMKPTLYFIAQWLSGIKLRLNEVKDKFGNSIKLLLIFKSAVVEWSQSAS